jgi:hypothetical protein
MELCPHPFFFSFSFFQPRATSLFLYFFFFLAFHCFNHLQRFEIPCNGIAISIKKLTFNLNHYLIIFIFLLLVQFHLFVIINFILFMRHIFHKIILNIYFDHIHIMCLYRDFSVHYTGYMLIKLKMGVLLTSLELR